VNIKNKLTQGKKMLQDTSYLKQLVTKGGPEIADYEQLDRTIKNLASQDTPISQNNTIHQIMKTAFTTSTMQGFAYHKPHGYAGDYEIIERIYDYYVCDSDELRNWDLYWQSRPAAHAVRNRKEYFKALMANTEAKHAHANILNIASGPARDMAEYCISKPNSGLRFDCIDQDGNAIEFATSRCMDFKDKIRFYHANAFKFHTDKKYEVVWSAGLFDYFDDEAFIGMTKKLLSFVKPGGKLVLGNFCDSNPSQDYMNLFDWKLHHRSKQKLIKLATQASASTEQIYVESEAAGVNLFLNIRKPIE
jgi:SAM-dependent methyltransferase